MAKVNDINNLELFKEIVDQNQKVTSVLNDLNKNTSLMTRALEQLSFNICKLNDENILHTTETNKLLKLLTGKILWIVVILVIVLSILAGVEKLQPVLTSLLG
jgi:hypothetical protein